MADGYEQRNRKRAHLERVLLVCGGQNAGKSSRLRSMFADPRLGTKGDIPIHSRVVPVRLSRERGLVVRFTSPHERGETLETFLDKIDRDLERAWGNIGFWRANFACAIQPNAANQMPDAVATCTAIHDAFWPERIRLVQIQPRQDGCPGDLLSEAQVDHLRNISVEVVTIDGRRPAEKRPDPNAFFLSSFFDFT